MIVPLDDLQRLVGLDGQINEILIANQGSATTSVELSGEVSRAVRVEAHLRTSGRARMPVDDLDGSDVGAEHLAEPRRCELAHLDRDRHGR